MEDHRGIGLIERDPLVRNLIAKGGNEKNLVERGVKERGLIGQDNTETSLIIMSLGTASMKQRWKTLKTNIPGFSTEWMERIRS
jgi:hypothetical protein